jgi:hypothetical protein
MTKAFSCMINKQIQPKLKNARQKAIAQRQSMVQINRAEPEDTTTLLWGKG